MSYHSNHWILSSILLYELGAGKATIAGMGVKNAYYGIGWRMLQYDDKQVAYHAGYVNNYISQIAIDRDANIGICVLVNGVSSVAAKIIPEFLKQYEEFSQEEPEVEFTAIGPPRKIDFLIPKLSPEEQD